MSPQTSSPTVVPSTPPSAVPSTTPSVSPTIEPSTNSPSAQPIIDPTGAPVAAPSIGPTEFCGGGDELSEIGDALIGLNLTESGLANNNLLLVLDYPPDFVVTSISFSGSSDPAFAYEDGQTSEYWSEERPELCLYKLSGTFSWEDAYVNKKIDFNTVQDGGLAYFESNINLQMEQIIYVRGDEFLRTYDYNIRYQIRLDTQVGVQFDVLDIYASHYNVEAESLCTASDGVSDIVYVMENSNAATTNEFFGQKAWWTAIVEEDITENQRLSTVEVKSTATVKAALEDYIGPSFYLSSFGAISRDSGNSGNAMGAGILAALTDLESSDEFNPADKRVIIVLSYSEPDDDPCTAEILQKQSSLGAEITIIAPLLEDYDPEAIFGCISNNFYIFEKENVSDLFNERLDTELTATAGVTCGTNVDLCNGDAFSDPPSIEGTYDAVAGELIWHQNGGVGNLTWQSTTGWTFSGYDDLIISKNENGDTSPTIMVSEVTTWYIVPCGTNTPEEYTYFRMGVQGFSLCRVGDTAGFADPANVVTEGNVASSYHTQVGSVTASNIDCALSCSGSCVTVVYSDGQSFDYCPSEISCGDWVNRCEDDCSGCVGYDSSGSSAYLVSESNYETLPGGETCSFGSNVGSFGACAVEIGALAYQCLGPENSNSGIRRGLEAKVEFRRDLEVNKNIPCHGLWGRWSKCSTTCGEGIEFKEFVHYSGNCPNENGDKEFRNCVSVECPELTEVNTYAASYEPDENGLRSKMNLHFSTTINFPWKFSNRDIGIYDEQNGIDQSSVSVKMIRDCNDETNDGQCKQEWKMIYMTQGVCDADGMHVLSLDPRIENGDTETIFVIIILKTFACGHVATDDLVSHDYISQWGGYTENSHTMTVTMAVTNPGDPTAMDYQVDELVRIISTHFNDADIQELNRQFKIPVQVSLDHSFTDREDLYDFFDYFPESVAAVLDLQRVSIADFTISSAVTTDEALVTTFVVLVSDSEKASVIWNLFHGESTNSFTSALAMEAGRHASWIEVTMVELVSVDSMTVGVTIQADLPDGTQSTNELADKLTLLGHEVQVHDNFGSVSEEPALLPVKPVTVVKQSEQVSTSESESNLWFMLFIIVISLIVAIIIAIAYRHWNGTKRSKEKKAKKLYDFETNNAVNSTTNNYKNTSSGEYWGAAENPATLPHGERQY